MSRDVAFSSKPITGTAPHTGLRIITGNCRHTTAHYRQITPIYVAFDIKAVYRYWRFTDKAGLFTTYYLPPVMKNYRFSVNLEMKSCTSSPDGTGTPALDAVGTSFFFYEKNEPDQFGLELRPNPRGAGGIKLPPLLLPRYFRNRKSYNPQTLHSFK